MATKFSRYLLALAEIAAKIDLLTRKYLIANARNFVKTLLGFQGSQIKRRVKKTGYLEALNNQIYLL